MTGSGKVPFGGLRFIRTETGTMKKIVVVRIHYDKSNRGYLPTSSTCANRLYLPDYPTYELFHEKLDKALQAGSVGFGFY